MKLTTSENANINYLAKIIKLDNSNFSPHPNADRLQLVHLYGNTISTSIDYKPGYYIYFPVECVIAPEFLKFHNLYKKSALNANPEEKGFFEESGRVKCIKLRGVASEGFIMPYSTLYDFMGASEDIYKENKIDLENTTFDTVENIRLVWKYVIPIKYTEVNLNNKSKRAAVIDKIVDNQFRFHIETKRLQDNIYKINPHDLIQISTKQHGTSVIFCNLLTKKTLNWKEKLAKKVGIPVIDVEYTTFCASRRIIRDPQLNPNLIQDFYDYNI